MSSPSSQAQFTKRRLAQTPGAEMGLKSCWGWSQGPNLAGLLSPAAPPGALLPQPTGLLSPASISGRTPSSDFHASGLGRADVRRARATTPPPLCVGLSTPTPVSR